jgi:hypothetical protein
MQEAGLFVVYKFKKGERAEFDNPANIIALVNKPEYVLNPSKRGKKTSFVYYVTALDRCNNESKPSIPVVISY